VSEARYRDGGTGGKRETDEMPPQASLSLGYRSVRGGSSCRVNGAKGALARVGLGGLGGRWLDQGIPRILNHGRAGVGNEEVRFKAERGSSEIPARSLDSPF
jgi:hypothetical protein